MNVLAVDGALGGFSAAIGSDGSIAGQRYETGNVALERGLSTVSAVLLACRASAGRDRPPGGRRWSRHVHRSSHRDRLRQGSGRRLEAPARRDRFLRYSRVWQDFRRRPHRRRGPARGDLGALSFRRPNATRVGTNGRRARRAGVAENGAARRGRRAGGRAPRACRTRHYRAIDRTARLPRRSGRALAAPSREPARSLHEVRADYGELPAVTMAKKR